MLKISHLCCIASLLFLPLAAAADTSSHLDLMQKHLKFNTWWPDPGTGLMWSSPDLDNYFITVNYPDANTTCSQLVLDGRTGWRLPTIDELEGVLKNISQSNGVTVPTFVWLNQPLDRPWIWSSTPAPEGFYSERMYQFYGKTASKPTDSYGHSLVCVRAMEPDIVEAARNANSLNAVHNLTELKARAAVFYAYQTYSTGEYQKSVDWSKEAVTIDPTLGAAYYGRGLAEGKLGQWDFAVGDLGQAKKYGADFYDTDYALKWAQDNQKAAKKGKTLNPKKNLDPDWTSYNQRYLNRH